jgi:hypothetical protein
VPFIFVRNVSEGFLVYGRGRSIKVDAIEGDCHQLARLGLIIFEGSGREGKPTQLGIDTAASLTAKAGAAERAVADVGFWKQRQADFLTYAIRFAELSAKWSAYHGAWILWWGSTPDGVRIPPEVLEALNETARKAIFGLPSSGITVGQEPWRLWLDFMRAGAWRGFSVAGNCPVSELVWDAGVKVGRPPVVVRRELGLSTHDEPEAGHWLKDLALYDVFRESADFCEDLARVLGLVTPGTQRGTTGNRVLDGTYGVLSVSLRKVWRAYCSWGSFTPERGAPRCG